MLGNSTLHVTYGEKCGRFISKDGKITPQDVPELNTNQEEADTCMFLHAKHAAQKRLSDCGHQIL